MIQITEGVFDAQKIVQAKGGFVNPAVRQTETGQIMHDGRVIQSVEFDVAVTVTEGSSCSGGGKLSVATVLKANAETASSEKNSTTSKISFKVPLAVPIDHISLNELKDKESKDKSELKAAYKRINQSLDQRGSRW
ncbi:hypothetical protein CTM88_20560 [Photobacterium aquimaris]|uniref:Uncharacterized protein n=1 Tax=Photobacterium aquimaris TaxID=512643 RepID=A0A2T3IEL4_9GAMM|nr:hypothetical protein [Photobacterium aquimaris]OBU14501.1 hypothetical protein AYY20_20680 [Photobacterium aquimaris]PSU21966.1 hypothetical protein CTM88_20560 [Photobacterium aquimaris]